MLHHRAVLVVVSCVALAVPAVAAEGFVFVQMCDTQLGMGGYDHDVESFRAAVDEINALHPDFVVICGDLVNDEHDDKSFEDFKAIKAGFEVPCYALPGNHDVGNKPTVEMIERYRRLIGEDYYSFEHKGIRFVLVNTQLWKAPVAGESEKHDAWFAEQLREAAAANQPVMVAGHFPPFANTPDEEESYFNLPLAKRTEILTLCKENGVIAYLAGHMHRNNEKEYEGIPIITSASTAKNFDGSPLGYRIWTVSPGQPRVHEYVAISRETSAAR